MTRDRGCGVVCAHFVAGVDLGERLALVDGVGALLGADDADGVVDRILLGPTTGAEMQRGEPDRERCEPLDVPAPRCEYLADEARPRQCSLVGVADLCPY